MHDSDGSRTSWFASRAVLFVCTHGNASPWLGHLLYAVNTMLHLRKLAKHFARASIATMTVALPVQAQQSAVLIGMAKFLGPRGPDYHDDSQLGIQYSTVLVVRDGPRVFIRATLPDIIVPHGINWWRVGVRSDCQIETQPSNSAGGNGERRVEHWVEQSYASPIGEVPQVPAPFSEPGDSCPVRLISDFKSARNSQQVADSGESSDLQVPFQPCIYRTVAITAVTSSFVSSLEHGGNSSECETRGFSWVDRASTWRLENPNPVRYSELLGARGLKEYNRVIIASSKGLSDSGFNCGLSEDFGKDPADVADAGWSLERSNGKWVAVALLQPGNADCQYGGPLSLPLPRQLVGYDTLRTAWASLARQIPGLKDAFTSPTGDLLVAVMESQIEIYNMNAQQVGSELLALPADRLVMVQWATGKYVEAWLRDLQSWQRRGLPSSALRKQQTTN